MEPKTALLGRDHQRETEQSFSLEQIQAFREASDAVGFKGRNWQEVYAWVNQTLGQ